MSNVQSKSEDYKNNYNGNLWKCFKSRRNFNYLSAFLIIIGVDVRLSSPIISIIFAPYFWILGAKIQKIMEQISLWAESYLSPLVRCIPWNFEDGKEETTPPVTAIGRLVVRGALRLTLTSCLEKDLQNYG